MDLTSKSNTYISVREAAGRLAVSTGTIRRLVKSGELEAYRFGNQIRIVSESLDQYIGKRKITV